MRHVPEWLKTAAADASRQKLGGVQAETTTSSVSPIL
jgi:hypothetical protein